MGEAKRRKAEIERLKQAEEEWLANLTPAERTAVQVSTRVHTQLVERKGLIGGCYLLAFFLNELLYSKYSIMTELVVGWVNDSTWPGVSSHAWIELGGKKIDISLTRTEHPDSQLPGNLIILDRVVRFATAKYTYYRTPPDGAVAFIQQQVDDGIFPGDVILEKNREHAYVSGLAKTREGVLTYFRRNPPDRTFEALVTLVA